MFWLLGIHRGPGITIPAVASLAGCGLAEARRPLAEPARAHLTAEHLPGRYTFHDLLRCYAAEQARGAQDRQSLAHGPAITTRLWPALRPFSGSASSSATDSARQTSIFSW
jgi:hypothetical protein